MDLMLPVISMALPFLLWPIEYFLPYPFFVEEIAKAVLVYFALREFEDKERLIKVVVLMGVLFAFSESVFYIFNITLVGNIGTYFQRIALTTVLHTATFLVILFPSLKKRKVSAVGVILAMVIHFLYNFLIPAKL